MKVERQRAVIAFTDITAFAPWVRRADPAQFMALMGKVYNVWEVARQEVDFMKPLADGCMMVRELKATGGRDQLIDFLRVTYRMGRSVNAVINRAEFPRPAGFRIRVVVGWCWKVTLPNGTIDYLGYEVNLCARLLEIQKQEPFLAAESVFDELRRRACKHLTFRAVLPDRFELSGVDREDLRKLRAFRFAA